MTRGKVQRDLIFDIGMHVAEDTDYYLGRGFRVVAVEADPDLVELAKSTFSGYLLRGQLDIVNLAIAEREGEQMEFYLSEKTEWNSLKKPLADRRNLWRRTITVKTTTLPALIGKFGVPYYCKIDIEGFDKICLESLVGQEPLPTYVSVETESLGEAENLTESQAIETLDSLVVLGYGKFKLVDQSTLRVLEPERGFYCADGTRQQDRWRLLRSSLGHKFPPGASGPFGPDLASHWLDYESAKGTLLRHREDYFRSIGAVNYGFWCDWHATFR
jgi:FkbM family methyltransferase